MNYKKISFIVVTIIVIALLGFVGYRFSSQPISPTPTPQVSGGTDSDTIEGESLLYENKKYGFSLMYPAVLTPVPGNGAIVTFKSGDAIEIRVLKIADSDFDFKNALIQDTFYDGSGANPKSFSEFTGKLLGDKNSFYFIKTGLFEGVLSLHYYLVRKDGIYDFSLISRGVDWTNPSFNLEEDPGHLYLKQMLASLVFGANVTPLVSHFVQPTTLSATPEPLHPYINPELGFRVDIPVDFTVNESGRNPLNGNPGFSGVSFHLSPSFTTGTNLSDESYISVETETEVACVPADFMTEAAPSSESKQVVINGISFITAEGGGVGAGNLYEERAYTTLHGNTCYGIKLFLHSGNIQNYDPSTGIHAFDRSGIETVYGNIVSSFKFL